MASSPNNSRAHAQPSPAHTTRSANATPSGPPSAHNNGLRPPVAGIPPRTPSQNTNSSQRSRASASAVRSPLANLDPPYVIDGPGGRIACVADVRGNLSLFNQIAAETNAQAIIHTGDFGFYDHASLERISDRTLRHLVQYSTLIDPTLRTKLLAADVPRGPAATERGAAAAAMRQQILQQPGLALSQFSDLLLGKIKLNVPVFTVWGACEDVAILERFRTGEYQVNNLHVLDEASTKAIEVGGVRLRLFGLGGAVVLHKLFDNGEGAATIAGGQGIMWTTALQIGELVDTAQKTFDPTETRVLITHASPGREGLLAQLALALKADLTISAGLHFRYGVSYNEFSVQHDAENYRNKLQHAKQAFNEIWDTVKTQVDAVIDENQRMLLNNALAVANRVAPTATATGAAGEEPAWKNTWNWNLPDAAYGHLVLGIKDGRVSAETKSQGFNFAYRRSGQPMGAVAPSPQTTAAAPSAPAPAPYSAVGPAPTPAAGRGAATVASIPAAPAATTSAPAGPRGSAPAAATTPSRANTQKPAEASGTAAAGGASAAVASKGAAAVSPASARPVKEKKERTRERGHESAASRSDLDGGFTSGTDGRKSPSGARKLRNPYTLYVSQLKEALPVSEDELRSYFGPAAGGITGIKLVFDKPHRRGASSGKEDAEQQRRQRPFAYVEFRDEAAMSAGFKRQGEVIKGDVKPVLEQADSNKASQAPAAEPAAGTAEKEPRRERQASAKKGGETDKEDEAGRSADDKPAGRNSRQRKSKEAREAKAEAGKGSAAAAPAAEGAGANAEANAANHNKNKKRNGANGAKDKKEKRDAKEAKEAKDAAAPAAGAEKEKKDKKEAGSAPAPAAPAAAAADASSGGDKKEAAAPAKPAATAGTAAAPAPAAASTDA